MTELTRTIPRVQFSNLHERVMKRILECIDPVCLSTQALDRELSVCAQSLEHGYAASSLSSDGCREEVWSGPRWMPSHLIHLQTINLA